MIKLFLISAISDEVPSKNATFASLAFTAAVAAIVAVFKAPSAVVTPVDALLSSVFLKSRAFAVEVTSSCAAVNSPSLATKSASAASTSAISPAISVGSVFAASATFAFANASSAVVTAPVATPSAATASSASP